MYELSDRGMGMGSGWVNDVVFEKRNYRVERFNFFFKKKYWGRIEEKQGFKT